MSQSVVLLRLRNYNEGMESTRWWRYVQDLIGEDTYRQAADKAGFNQSAFSRWSRGAAADPAFVVKLARAYHANVLKALVEAELITDEEADLRQIAPKVDLSEYDAEDLSEEISRRLKRLSSVENELAKAISVLQPGVSNPLEKVDLAHVRHLVPVDIEKDVEPERYVAKRKRQEPGEGDDDYGPGA